MAMTLRPEHEQLVTDALQTGAYRDPDEVIERALEMLRSQDEWLRDHRNVITAKIERAFAQFERGEFLSPEESRSDMEKRKLVWAAKKHRS